MATQSTRSTVNKKPPLRKSRRKSSTKTSNFKKHMMVFLGVFLMISMLSFGFFLGQNEKENKNTQSFFVKKLLPHTETIEKNFSKNQTKNPENGVEKEPSVVVAAHLETKVISEASDTVEKFEKKVPSQAKKTKPAVLAYRGKKPKLVIIIDDVSSAKQLASIRSLAMKVTPSIFPPYERSKSNHKLAQGLEHYMIHLPMQSGKAYDKQYATLRVTDSGEKMEARVKELRRLFPTARYVNNHTGSVFTDNYNAMQMLYTALRKEGFVFVDSRTIGSTKIPKIAHAAGDAYVARDIFIDNKKNIPYIHAQLKKAVQNAKKNGYAIAIGHPHNITMKALGSAKDIFEEVELVYIDEIYRKRK